MQRVVLLSYAKASNRISFRHYSIVAQPCGVSKSVKALIGKRQVPNLGAFQDVAEFLIKSGYGSVSPSVAIAPTVSPLSLLNPFSLSPCIENSIGKKTPKFEIIIWSISWLRVQQV